MKSALVILLPAVTSAAIVVTGSPQVRIVKDAAIAGTITTGKWPCWKTGTVAAALTPIAATECLVAGTATNIGKATTVVCAGAASGTAWTAAWDDVSATRVSFIECTAAGTGDGAAVQVDVHFDGVVVPAATGATNALTLFKGDTIYATVARSTHHLCWKSGASAVSIQKSDCLVAGTATKVGAPGAAVQCGAINTACPTSAFGANTNCPVSVEWDDVTATSVALFECGVSAGAGDGVALVLAITETTTSLVPTASPVGTTSPSAAYVLLQELASSIELVP